MFKAPYTKPDSKIIELVGKYDQNPDALLAMFQELQAQKGTLSKKDISEIAIGLHIPPEQAYGVATFYSMLNVSEQDQPKMRRNTLRLCDGPVCWLHHSGDLHDQLQKIQKDNPEWQVERTSCLGLCDRAPSALVNVDQYGPLKEDGITGITRDGASTSNRYIPIDYSIARPGEVRVMLDKTGKIDPDSIDSALAQGAYQGLNKALMNIPEFCLIEVEKSGLMGRGGAGFPVGRKWRFVAQADRNPKYIICNADESEPLVFKDRVLIETNPHQLLEGMAIAGYATGAQEGFIYIPNSIDSDKACIRSHLKVNANVSWGRARGAT